MSVSPKTEFKTLSSLSKFPRQKTDVTCTALYIFTQKLIHTKCPTLLTGTSKNAVIRGPVWSTVKEHPAFCSLSALSSAWVSVWQRQMGREMRASAEGPRLCYVWAAEALVTGHCQVGSAAGPASRLCRNAVILSVVKER